MTQSTHNKTISRIYGNGRGWTFSQKDFSDLDSAENIRVILSRLKQKGTIRSLCRGIYDYPSYSKLLKTELAPQMDQAAHALARKYGWRIQVSGNAALNLLGLSRQVPAQIIYLSDGPTKEYRIGTQTLQFKKKSLKESGFKLRESNLVVQAIKENGKELADEKFIGKLSKALPKEKWPRILKDTLSAPSWVKNIILDCEKESTNG